MGTGGTMTGKTGERRSRGFRRASGLVSTPVRQVGEARGFAVSRVLTHWAEIAGTDIATHTRPVEVTYGRGGGLGATLTVLTTGAHAPMVEMQKERLRERVNACYGYAAIGRIRITQTAPTGFAEGQAEFAPAPSKAPSRAPDPETEARAMKAARDIGDADLRAALARLGTSILSKKPN